MDRARWERIQELFHEALARPRTERAAFVETACAGDPELTGDVLALLEEDARGEGLLSRDRAELAYELLGGATEPPVAIGPYRVLRLLGRGGMGVVFLAEREDLHHRVAIKVLRDALSPARRERFAREKRVLAQLSHPSIARLFDAGVLPDGTPYFVMEWVDGVPILEYCEANGCDIAERLRLFRQVCDAVHHAHRQAFIHRDLKPSNILVTADGPDDGPSVKLVDFGIAKQLEDAGHAVDQTLTGLRLMTPAYAAPEQFTGEPVGVYTDVYALGVLLYELLAGSHPFDLSGLTPGQAEAVIREQDPEAPSLKAGRAPAGSIVAANAARVGRPEWADLDVLCLTAMHKDPRRRYDTVEALVRDLDRFVLGKPLEARSDTLGYRAGKFVRSHRRPVAAAGLAAAALAGLLGFHAVRLAEQRDRAQTAAEKAERISEYLIGLFEAGDPYGAEADSLDVSGLLARGERRAEELSGQPELQAAMLNVLGRVHTQLSDYDRAARLIDRALSLRRQGGLPLDIAESLSSLASLHVDQGRYDEAEAALREALAIRERLLPPNHPQLAADLSDLGTVLRYRGRYEEAEALHRLAVRIRRAIHDRPHEELAFSLNRLAVALFQQGKYAEAERYYREALAVGHAAFGPDHVSVTRIQANLGKLYEELGDYAAADSLLTRALDVRRAALGDDHFETAVGLGQLASLVSFMGEHERAERYLRESLAIRERILPPAHASIGTTLNNLASTLEHRGAYDEAADLYARAADIYRAGLGARHRFTGIALSNLGYARLLAGDHQAALAGLLDGLAILEEVHPDDHQELAHNRSRLGAALVALGRFADAEPLLVQAYQSLEAQLGAEHPRTRQAAERLVGLYEAWGMPERAGPYRQALAAEDERAS